MTYKEYKGFLSCDLYRDGGVKPNWLNRIRIKYFQPNTNCVYLARKCGFYTQKGNFANYTPSFCT